MEPSGRDREDQLRGSEEDARLAHNQEDAGSSPAPATIPAKRREWWHGPTWEERAAARVNVGMVRDYSRGSLRDHVAQAESIQELTAIAEYVEKLVDTGKIATSSATKIVKLGEKRAAMLNSRLVQPAGTGRLLVPRDPREIQRNQSGLVLLK